MHYRNGAQHFVACELQALRNLTAALCLPYCFHTAPDELLFVVTAGEHPDREENHDHDDERQYGYKGAHNDPLQVQRALEHRERQINSCDSELLRKLRTNAGRHELAEHLAVFAHAALAEREDVLH